MAYDYTDLQKSSSTPGIASIVYMIPVSWMETFGAINSTSSTAVGASVIIDEDHVPKTGKGFIEFYSTQSASDFAGTSVGEEDSETMEWTINLQHPGLKPAIAEFIKNARGERWILIIKPVDCTDPDAIPWQFGTNCSPVALNFENGSGQPNNGSMSVKAIGKWYHPYPLFYAGNIPLKP